MIIVLVICLIELAGLNMFGFLWYYAHCRLEDMQQVVYEKKNVKLTIQIVRLAFAFSWLVSYRHEDKEHKCTSKKSPGRCEKRWKKVLLC